MISEKETTRISKFLSLVLRHKPEAIGITLDTNGWANVNTLIQQANTAGIHLTHELLVHVVETNNKKRFAFTDSFDKIRASQGHSIQVELNYTPQIPPEILYHGTGIKSVELILTTGLEKRNRQHVHLSKDVQTAVSVGKRHGKPVVFEVLAKQMVKNDFTFYLSANGVWLTDNVPEKYLKLYKEA